MSQRRLDGDVARGVRLRREGVPVVVDFSVASRAWENAVDGGGALVEDGGDEDGGTQEELSTI